MATEKTDAIVLRVVEFSETSCVVTLFTRDFGKISALAKGARRPKSAFESAIDLLAVVRIVFINKSSDVLDLLTEAKLERRFRAASTSLTRLYAGYYVAELLNELTDNGAPVVELYEAADAALQNLDAGGEPSRVTLRFELTALRLLGHLPSLEACAACGGDIKPENNRVLFGQAAGGLLCHKCREGQKQIVSVTSNAIEVLRQFARTSDDAWQNAPLAPVHGELRGVMNHFITLLTGRRPRLYDFRAGYEETNIA